MNLSLKSVYANIQALKYHDIQSNRAKSGNQKQRGNGGNRGRGGGWRGHVKKPTVSTDAKADVNKSVDCDGQLEGNTDDEQQQQPAVGAVAATKMGANSCEGPLLVVIPQPPEKYQQPSEGGVATLSESNNHQQLVQTNSADNSGARQQLQCANRVVHTPLSPTSPLTQGASATGVVSAAAGAGLQPIQPQKTSAATKEKRDNTGTHQPLQGATATGDNADKNNSSNSPETQQLPIGKIICTYKHVSIIYLFMYLLILDKTVICKYFLRGYCKHQGESENRLKSVRYFFLLAFFNGVELIKLLICCQSDASKLMTGCPIGGRSTKTVSGLRCLIMRPLRRTSAILKRHMTGIKYCESLNETIN